MRFFHRSEQKEKTDVRDEIAKAFAKLTLHGESRDAVPSRTERKDSGDFVGGFLAGHRTPTQSGDDRWRKPLPATPSPQPATQTHVPRRESLPTPTAMRMPEPQPGWAPAPSLTTQFAQSMWNETAIQSQPGATLGPPPPAVPHRPHSDPSSSTTSESISAPYPPSTPKRTKPSSSQTPATLPTKISQSRSSSVATPTKTGRRRASSASDALPSTAVSSSGSQQCAGLTKAGQRCRNMVKVSTVLMTVYDGDDNDSEGGAAVFCSVHREKQDEKEAFVCPVTGDWIKFAGRWATGF